MTRILVVDDSGAIRKAIRRILESLSCEVTEAEHGQAALDLLASATPFDAVLCDIDMPTMDGLAFLGAVRDRGVLAPPIIMCTTHTAFDRIEQAISLGASEYIMKPFDAEIIRSKLDTCGVS